MTVSNTQASVQRLGDGTTKAFPFTFEIVDAASVKVGFIVGSSIVVADPSTYSVSPLGDLSGGTVTFVNAPVNATKIYIYRETPLTQNASVSSQQSYNPKVAEDVWDKTILIIQELAGKIARAVLSTPDVDPATLISTLFGYKTDAELAQAAASAAAVDAAVSAAQALAKVNSMVAFPNNGIWQTAFSYKPSDLYSDGNSTYLVIATHVSTSIAADVAASKAIKIISQGATGAGTGDMLNSANLAGLANALTAVTNLGFNTLGLTFRDPVAVNTFTPGTDAQGQGQIAAKSRFIFCDIVSAQSGVTLPSTVTNETGREIVIIGNAASTAGMNVYPTSGQGFEGKSLNTPIFVPIGWRLRVWQRFTTQWAYVLEARETPRGGIVARATARGTAVAATYTRSGNTVTIPSAAHALTTGMQVLLDFTSGAASDGYYTVTVIDANTFTIQDAVSGVTSGNVTIVLRVLQNTGFSSFERSAAGQYYGNLAVARPTNTYQLIGSAAGRANHPSFSLSTRYDVVPAVGKVGWFTGPTGGSGSVGFFEDSSWMCIIVVDEVM